ncbi:hypothetical protein CLAC_04430 [Corynebacterium lactis RW2-5]|uniref:Uncharacterized protein n=1 Tax=Corynebacterium lactis RW2-5 TaxID=1408189 RepID=A0A0K2H383_9CORY|nr:hypothetical protein CLAC_04430 [Corynebacterium lactis RW2-5]
MLAHGRGIRTRAFTVNVLFGIAQESLHLVKRKFTALEITDCSRIIDEPLQNAIYVGAVTPWEADKD